MTKRRLASVLLATVAALASHPAFAVVPAPGSPLPAPSAGSDAPSVCQDSFPEGAARPKMTESFPAKGKSGHALVLEATLEHGKGESVLPSGIGARADGEAIRALERAGFFFPDPKGGSEATLVREVTGERARTKLSIPVVALPEKPGRKDLVLPPLPIAIARASGEVRTLCTAPHPVTVEDPIANTPDARPKQNPWGRRQLEEWTAAKYAAIGAAAALAAGALALALFRAWKRRPVRLPPPPPPRPPWEVALEELFDVKISALVAQGRFAEHFDRVSDAVRRYLGARYGFDGLETTTREAMAALGRVTPRIAVVTEVQIFLEEADLVKFAKITPDERECEAALEQAEKIVRQTMPMVGPAPASEAARAATSGAAPPPPPTGGPA